MVKKIAEGSTYGIEVEEKGATIFFTQLYTTNEDRWVRIHFDDIPELIKELERISKDESKN
jgi:hypothetical protein